MSESEAPTPVKRKSQRTSGAPSLDANVSSNGAEGYPFPETPSGKHKFKSYRLRGEYEKPWINDPAMKKTRWNNLIVGLFILLGFAGAGAICFVTVWPYRPADVSFLIPLFDSFESLGLACGWRDLRLIHNPVVLSHLRGRFQDPQHGRLVLRSPTRRLRNRLF